MHALYHNMEHHCSKTQKNASIYEGVPPNINNIMIQLKTKYMAATYVVENNKCGLRMTLLCAIQLWRMGTNSKISKCVVWTHMLHPKYAIDQPNVSLVDSMIVSLEEQTWCACNSGPCCRINDIKDYLLDSMALNKLLWKCLLVLYVHYYI